VNVKTYDRLYINGEWVKPHGEEVDDVINPATEELVGCVPQGDSDDVNRAVQAAAAAFYGWSSRPASERAELIEGIASRMEQRVEEIARLITAEQGMPISSSIGAQAKGPVVGMRSFAKRALQMEQSQRVGSSIVHKDAVGVCGLITPWNYPLHQIVGKVAPALAAGCTMVLKPSEEAPLNAFLFAQILHEAGLPAGVFNLVSGPGAIVGEAMCAHPGIDLISFTGSVRAGIRVSSVAASTVKRVCLELGGKSPFIITEDADFEAAIDFGLRNVMVNCGQTCTALTRMLLPKSRYEEAVAIAKRIADSLRLGDPMNADTFVGPMCSSQQRQTVLRYISTGIEEGARLVTGGTEMPEGIDRGFYVRPTLFADVDNRMTIAQEEIFGPVLCLIPYEDESQAIAIANDSTFGLSSGVWAGTVEHAEKLARRIRAGQCRINGAGFNYEAPFGGYKMSGNGREWGDEGLAEYVELKPFHYPAQRS
jgi:aldehyde dehydrogenase (NAD+)